MAAESAPRHSNGLTRLRFVFIAWVVIYHLDLALGVTRRFGLDIAVIRRGYLGVDGFFLLSGFALYLGYAARPPRSVAEYWRFLLRRVAKIWPLHLLALALLAGLVLVAWAAGITIRQPERFGLRDLLLQVLLINAWETTDLFAWNYPSWALSAEWAGYLLFPWLLWCVLRLPVASLVPWLALLWLGLHWLASGMHGSLNQALHLGLVRFGLEFLCGLTLARLLHGRHLAAWVPLPAGILLAALGLLLAQDAVTVAGVAALIGAAWALPPRHAAARDLPYRLGEASFGVYLSFVFIEAALVGVQRVLLPGPWLALALLVLGFAANLLAGWAAWRWVEVPAHRWLLARLQGTAPAAASRHRA